MFNSTDAEAEQRAPVASMTLESRGAPANGAMLLRYLIENAGPEPAEA